MDDDTSRHASAHPDTTQFTLTIEEAAALFDAAGVSKNIRTLQRNCEEGILTCTKVETANFWQYLVETTSVDRRIKELKNVKKISVQHNPDTSRHTEVNHDPPRQTATHHDEPRHTATENSNKLEEAIKNLEAQLKGLEIDKAVRDRSIQFLEGQLAKSETRQEQFVERLIEQSRLIGDMERQLHLLEAPIKPIDTKPVTDVVPTSDYKVVDQPPVEHTNHDFLSRQREAPPPDNPHPAPGSTGV